jgi:hypothetical protein
VSPKRGDRAAPPPVGEEYDIRFGNAEAAKGWDSLGHHTPANLRRAFERIRSAPRSFDDVHRHHRLKGALGQAVWKGRVLERWQYEVTGGGRIWFLVDDDERWCGWFTRAPGIRKLRTESDPQRNRCN